MTRAARRRRWLPWALGAVLVLAVGAGLVLVRSWSERDPTAMAGQRQVTVDLLASTELGDLSQLVDLARKEAKVTVRLHQVETVEATRLIAEGRADGAYDAVWLDSDRYLRWADAIIQHLDSGTPIMNSPVLLGLRSSTVDRLGWRQAAPTWQQLAQAAGSGGLTFGMSDPTRASSGQAAVITAALGLSGAADGLTSGDLDRAAPGLSGLFAAQKLTMGNAGALMAAFAAGDGGPVDGVFTYEAQLLRFNATQKPADPLVGVYPSDGAVVGDGTFVLHSLLRPRSSEAPAGVRRLAAYLLEPATQQRLACQLGYRPAVAGVDTRACPFPGVPLFSRPFPRDQLVAQELVTRYLNRYRRAARTVFVLDMSGSMAGTRMEQLRAAVGALAGSGTATAAEPDRFRAREQVILVPFATSAQTPVTVDIPESEPQPALTRIRDAVNALQPAGQTAMYDALVTGYEQLISAAAQDPNRMVSMVLVTDGSRTSGRSLDDLLRYRAGLPESIQQVRILPVLVGDADPTEMTRLAEQTRGQVLDARQRGLVEAFQQARSQQ